MRRVRRAVGALKSGSSDASEARCGGAKGNERNAQAKAKHRYRKHLHYGWSGNVREESKVHSP